MFIVNKLHKSFRRSGEAKHLYAANRRSKRCAPLEHCIRVTHRFYKHFGSSGAKAAASQHL
jgi:hypothetical protein